MQQQCRAVLSTNCIYAFVGGEKGPQRLEGTQVQQKRIPNWNSMLISIMHAQQEFNAHHNYMNSARQQDVTSGWDLHT